MRSRRQGGTWPTASPMKVDRGRGTLGFKTRDEADGARVTNAPNYYERHERWKQNLSEEDFKALLWCILPQHFNGKLKYSVAPHLAHELSCPEVLATAELRLLQNQDGYEFIAKQVHSRYLAQKLHQS